MPQTHLIKENLSTVELSVTAKKRTNESGYPIGRIQPEQCVRGPEDMGLAAINWDLILRARGNHGKTQSRRGSCFKQQFPMPLDA